MMWGRGVRRGGDEVGEFEADDSLLPHRVTKGSYGSEENGFQSVIESDSDYEEV